MRVIGLAGRKGAGKSTAARGLAPALELAFAEPMRAMLRAGFGLSGAEMDAKESPIARLGGVTPRHLLQSLGTDWGRQKVDPDLWVRLWRVQAEMALGDAAMARVNGFLVAPDVRFPNEAAAIRALGGVVVLIDRPTMPRNGDPHPSETSLTLADIDSVVSNASTVERLHAAVRAAAGT